MIRVKSLLIGIIALVTLVVSSCQQPTVPSSGSLTEEITCVEAPPKMPRLTPRPASVAGIDKLQVSLNGTWQFNPKPPWPWPLDSNALGTNDFRSTKRNIIWASLKDTNGYGILVRSDSNQSTRSFAEGDRIRLLVAGYSTGGADPFFASHLANERRPLKKGSVLEDTVHLELVSP